MIRSAVWLLISALVLSIAAGCAQKPLTPTSGTIRPMDESDLLFQEGEQFFQKGELDQALLRYNQYLARYPQGRYNDQALYRMGFIFHEQGATDISRAYFKRVVNEFPESVYADDAQLALIDFMSAEKRYAEAVQAAVRMNEKQLGIEVRHQLWRRMAWLYNVLEDPGNTALYAYQLYNSLPEPERDQWGNLFQETLSRLGRRDIEILWDHVDEPQLRSRLMYQQALAQVTEEQYDDALELLTAFLQIFPDHPYAADAAGLVETLSERLSFTPFTVGCLLPLSGPYQLYGQRALQGIELALSRVQGGEINLPIRLVIKDTASQDARAVQAVKELADARVGAIIGPIATAPAAARQAQKLHIPIITLTQKPGIVDTGDFVFRHFITPQNQAHTLVDYFVNQIGLREFAVLYPRETYGSAFLEAFWDEVVRQGGHIVGAEHYDTDQTDFKTVISKLVGTLYEPPSELHKPAVVRVRNPQFVLPRFGTAGMLEELLPDAVTRLTGLFFEDPDPQGNRGPALGRSNQVKTDRPILDFDVLFIPDAPKMAALILPQLAYYDVRDIYLAGTNLWHSDQLIELTGDYAQNAVMVDGFFKKSASREVQQFVKSYQDIYNADPGLIEAFSFDTAGLIFELMAHPGLKMRHLLRDALLQASDYMGITGPIGFAENGEAIKQLNLLRLRGSRFVEISRQ